MMHWQLVLSITYRVIIGLQRRDRFGAVNALVDPFSVSMSFKRHDAQTTDGREKSLTMASKLLRTNRLMRLRPLSVIVSLRQGGGRGGDAPANPRGENGENGQANVPANPRGDQGRHSPTELEGISF
jgi:hypothetical protein